MQVSVNELDFKAVKSGHTAATVISSAVTLSPSETYNLSHSDQVLMQALTQNIRYTLDGTTPTASVGFQLKAGDPPVIILVKGNTLRVIEETATANIQFCFGG